MFWSSSIVKSPIFSGTFRDFFSNFRLLFPDRSGDWRKLKNFSKICTVAEHKQPYFGSNSLPLFHSRLRARLSPKVLPPHSTTFKRSRTSLFADFTQYPMRINISMILKDTALFRQISRLFEHFTAFLSIILRYLTRINLLSIYDMIDVCCRGVVFRDTVLSDRDMVMVVWEYFRCPPLRLLRKDILRLGMRLCGFHSSVEAIWG